MRFGGIASLALAAAWRLAMAVLALAALTVAALAQTVAVNPATLPNPVLGGSYLQTMSATGGLAPYSFAVEAGGALPPGLNLSSAGQLSGTPSALGTYNFVVQATDSTDSGAGGPFSGAQSYSLTVGTPVLPAVTSVAVPSPSLYGVGATLDFHVSFDQPVTVTGTPSMGLTVGASTRAANYVSGSGSSVLAFRYSIQAGDLDADGIAVGTAIALNGGTIRNASNTDAALTLSAVGSTSGVLVDGIVIVAADDFVSTQDNVPVTGNVLTNDTGRGLIASLVTAPVNGSVVLNADGSFTYTPNTNYSGTDSFIVQVANTLYTDTSTVTITMGGLTTPTVSSVSPASGVLAGGTSVTISGSDFDDVDGVSFGGVAASSFTVNSASSITAVTPAAASGGPVDIVASKGAVSGSLTNGYTYLAPGALNVVDGADFVASGPVGGPFAPASKTWTLSNGGGSDIDVLVSGPGGVFDISGAADGVPFTLAAGGSRDITVSLNAGANGLAAGAVGGAVTFVNHTNGSGNTTRQVSLDVQAATLGSVTIRQETAGSDAVFGFRSAIAGLNLSIATMGGSGQSADIALPAGRYSVVADDMSGAGYSLVGLVCSDSDSVGDVASRTASIVLDAGEAVICTFSAVNSAEATTALIEEFLDGRARQILANVPDGQRRIARLNGVVSGGGSLGSTLLNYLPGVVEGVPVGVSTSLAAIDAMAGNQQPGALDVWFEGNFSLFESEAGEKFSSAALGADYLLNPDLLIGGFVQFDFASRNFDSGAKASGTGWLAGPYLTARLSDNLYLDLLAAGGQSSNAISPSGSYEDDFDATRYLLSAALQGQWSHENWTFSSRAQLSYFEETSDGYADSLGVSIPAVTAGLGQLAVGPGIGYRLTLNNGVVVDLGLRAEGVLDIAGGSELGELQGRLSGTVGFGLVGGANIGLSARLDGIGSGEDRGSVGVRLSLPAR